MSIPILATRLYIPPPRPRLVLRPHLNARLTGGLYHHLSLIAAPAGFGKTTLVSAWVADCGRPTAWLSLDEGDNDLTRFLTYLISSLRTIAADLGAGVVGALQSPQPPPADVLLTDLLNEITTLPERVVLVLDDYHLIDAKPVDDALTFLLEHLPPQLHLVIVTREDPQFPLARLRARSQLTELRAADLRFTASEAADFLNRVMGLDLSADAVAALDERTEGWIAGLQLAALSLQGHQDVAGFIRAFAGDHRYIADYLVDEVLRRQPEGARTFLLQTSILDRLHGPLCDAVTGQEGGSTRLEALERGNFFVVPLDNRRQWYRYHHLFADVLSAHLMADYPAQVATLHRRASAWYERQGSAAAAIRHALAAGDVARAADLIERAMPALRQSRQEATLLGWLTALPDELLQIRPVLSAAYAMALLMSGQLAGVEDRLRDAEHWLDPTTDRSEGPDAPSVEMVVVDDAEFRRLPAAIALYRAALAQARGEVGATIHHARRVLDLVPEDDHLVRGSAAGFLALASWASGDLETAHRAYAECSARVQRAGYLSDALGCAIALADIRLAQGRLHEARRTYEQGMQLAAEQGEPVLRGTADMYVGLSALHREQNDLQAATQDLLSSQELGERAGLPQHPYRWRVAMARIREAQGDLEGALALLGEAERLYRGDFFPNVRPIAAQRARILVAQGRVGEALDWTRERGLSAQDELSYLRECEYLTLARVLLAQYQSERSAGAERSIREAIGLLERLLRAAEDGGRRGSALDILVVQALAHQLHGDIPAALIPLERALQLAEPEGYVRLFVDEGPPMTHLLHEAAARGLRPAYTDTLLAACGVERPRSVAPSPPSQALSEPLSQRELEILRLLRTELSGPEIARELVVALSTVRTHTKRIYGKLDVTNRRAAVKRAADLGLI